MRILVLGGGRVGSAVAADLSLIPGMEVAVADRDTGAVERAAALAHRMAELRGGEPALGGVELDAGDPTILELALRETDLVVGALPGRLGYDAVRRAVEAARPVVDISFFSEDPFTLDGRARELGVPVIVDAGVAPGLSNLFLGHALERLDEVGSFACRVGGIPAEPEGPWGYRAPFSPGDVVEEYTRPARLRRRGDAVTLPALSELETVEVEGVGTLEAFVTDGLRTVLDTTDVPDMVEKTLRWPGHAAKVAVLRDGGFLEREPVEVDGTRVSPRALAERLLFDQWRLRDDEDELTVMRVEVEGRADGQPTRLTLDLLDRRDPETGVSSMARTTGYTCTALVRLVAEGLWNEPGVAPPEVVGRRRGTLDFVVEHLARRGVEVRLREEDGGAG